MSTPQPIVEPAMDPSLSTSAERDIQYDVPAVTLAKVASIFLRLGSIGFGGPAAHIALMHEEFVGRRRWISPREFLDLNAVTNLIPGPASTEMALHLGHRLRGLSGMVVAGISFIAPAATMVLAMALAYQSAPNHPMLLGALLGLKPVTVALILLALIRLVPVALPHGGFVALGVLCGLLRVAGLGELWVFAGAAALVITLRRIPSTQIGAGAGILMAGMVVSLPRQVLSTTTAALVAAGTIVGGVALGLPSLIAIFGAFFKIGATLYGSGYVLLPYLETELVRNHGWLTQQQVLDAVAVTQLTPGPLFTGATFCGFLLGGIPGSLVATVGIFLPGFVMVALTSRHIPRLRQSRLLGDMLDGVNAAAIGLMGATLFVLGREAIPGYAALVVTVVSTMLLVRSTVHPMVPLVAGAVLGAVFPGVMGMVW
jgi:chromate transporter